MEQLVFATEATVPEEQGIVAAMQGASQEPATAKAKQQAKVGQEKRRMGEDRGAIPSPNRLRSPFRAQPDIGE